MVQFECNASCTVRASSILYTIGQKQGSKRRGAPGEPETERHFRLVLQRPGPNLTVLVRHCEPGNSLLASAYGMDKCTPPSLLPQLTVC